MASQERLFLAIEVPLPKLTGTVGDCKLTELLKLRNSVKQDSGWVQLLHITLYFFQHRSRKQGDKLWTSNAIIEGLTGKQFKSFPLVLKKVTPCGTRTLRLSVNDGEHGLKALYESIVEALGVTPMESGWEGGHVSLYRFNQQESQAMGNGTLTWANDLIEQYQDIDYSFHVTEFRLYLSEKSGYQPLASFSLIPSSCDS